MTVCEMSFIVKHTSQLPHHDPPTDLGPSRLLLEYLNTHTHTHSNWLSMNIELSYLLTHQA